ncbi:MAG TPA: DUF58 domain-containing protein, partial [Anaerolineales bacterium]|nr:DUF58 domain-containing protein [Anaerolineales bacterium]
MPRLRLRQPAIPILLAFLLGVQLLEPARVWTILLVGLSGMFVTAYLWAWTVGRSLHLRRETRLGWVQVGGQIEERFTLSNSSLFPAAWIQFNDQSTLPGFHAGRSTSIGAGYFEQWLVNATCKQRGLYYLGDANIQTGDPFGIFDINIHAPQRTSVLVLPQIAALPELPIAPSGSFGDGRTRRNAPEQTIHASSVREYYHGDSTRLIHWPTTARTNKVFVRLMESAPEGDWWILLDLDKEYMFGKGWDSIEEQSVALAASLATLGLHKRKSVGLIANSRELTWLTPGKGEGHRWEIMQGLALAGPAKLDLGTVLERTRPSLGRHHSLIVITASTNPDWLKTFFPLTRRNIVPTVFLMDVSTFNGGPSAENTAALLQQSNIACHVIPRGMLEPPNDSSDQPGRWTWRSTPTGEIV